MYSLHPPFLYFTTIRQHSIYIQYLIAQMTQSVVTAFQLKMTMAIFFHLNWVFSNMTFFLGNFFAVTRKWNVNLCLWLLGVSIVTRNYFLLLDVFVWIVIWISAFVERHKYKIWQKVAEKSIDRNEKRNTEQQQITEQWTLTNKNIQKTI